MRNFVVIQRKVCCNFTESLKNTGRNYEKSKNFPKLFNDLFDFSVKFCQKFTELLKKFQYFVDVTPKIFLAILKEHINLNRSYLNKSILLIKNIVIFNTLSAFLKNSTNFLKILQNIPQNSYNFSNISIKILIYVLFY